MNKELRNKIIKYNNLKVKYNKTHSDKNITFKTRHLLDVIISSMIKENKGYENLYSKSGNTKTLKQLKLYELNDIRKISDIMSLGLIREK